MAAKISGELSLPLAYGVTREQAERIGAWWEQRRQIVQPAAFVLDQTGTVLSATYSTGPAGRLDGDDALRFIRFQEKQKQQG